MPSARHKIPKKNNNKPPYILKAYVSEEELKEVAARLNIQITPERICRIKQSKSKYAGLYYAGYEIYLEC
jgi:hypothetical protein